MVAPTGEANFSLLAGILKQYIHQTIGAKRNSARPGIVRGGSI
ncbi:hypothetical protein [Mesorhizobium sp.]|nr:hypothetical protein [Mesorhizobium sp.]